MQKQPVLALLLGSLSILAQHTAPANSELPVEIRLEQLETSVTELRQEVKLLRQEIATSKPAAQTASAKDLQNSFVLQSWNFREMQVKFNQFHALDLELYNGYDKAIREIDARLEFHNLLGEHVYSLRVALGEEIPPHSHYTDRGTASNKRLFGKGSVLEKISAASVTANLVIRRVVFADGDVREF